MTFGGYIRTRRSFTEAGFALRQAVVAMPVEIQAAAEVQDWLREQGASELVSNAARAAVGIHRDVLRRRRAAAARRVALTRAGPSGC